MASFRAIGAVGEALRRMLEDACPRSESSGFPRAEFAIIQAGQLLTTPMKEGISLFLYRVSVNGSGRNRGSRVSKDGHRLKPSLPLDLYYLLTPWAASAVKQQNLLGWAMRTLEDTPILPSGLLNHAGPEHETFAPAEAVEFGIEQMSIRDTAEVWEALKANWQLSVAYVARSVAIDSELEFNEGPRVRSREFDYAVGPST